MIELHLPTSVAGTFAAATFHPLGAPVAAARVRPPAMPHHVVVVDLAPSGFQPAPAQDVRAVAARRPRRAMASSRAP